MAPVHLRQLRKSFSSDRTRTVGEKDVQVAPNPGDLSGDSRDSETSDQQAKPVSGTSPAVDNVSLDIADGELLVLVGPSGCGKSTTLRLIAGLEDLDTGEIEIGGKRVDGLAPKDRNISMVFQNYALYPHMNVYENIAFGLKLRAGGGWLSRLVRKLVAPAKAKELEAQRAEIPEKVQAVATKLGIEKLLRRMPRELSGGERQRVALGRAIVRKPVAFLFDEPLSNLDAKLRVEMRREIKRLHQDLAATMIYVTHDQVEAMTLGDRIAIMNRGKIVQCDTPANVYARPAHRFVAGFIGSPPMNLIHGRIEIDPAERDMCDFVGSGLRVSLPAAFANLPVGEVELGVRPEVIDLLPAASEPSQDQVCLAEGQVVLVESLGDSQIIQLRAGNADLLVRSSTTTAKIDETWRLACSAESLHFFHGKTGERMETAASS